MCPQYPRNLVASAILVFAPLVTLSAQGTSAANAADAQAKETTDDAVVLSPFTVTTSKDVGYLAGNTLAGSRLNTRLKDTGAAISVITPEFMKDIGAKNMKDLILFENNAVPDYGDAAININGNQMMGATEWQLRIRGLAASYSRNYFKWEASSDFYNVDRIDQSRGPNSILFGFGSPGGLVNTTTKQAVIGSHKTELSYTAGSWGRNRGSVDTNVSPNGQLAVRVNAMAENGHTWREFEFDRARRAALAATWQVNKESTLRVEGETGKVDDNVTRPWLAIDQSFVWRNASRPTYYGQWPSGVGIKTLWPDHFVVGQDGVVRNWIGRAQGSNEGAASGAYWGTGSDGKGGSSEYWAGPSWAGWANTPTNNAIIPRTANLAGPDATRETKYKTASAFFESSVNKNLSYEIAANYQSIDFLAYDPQGSRATTYYGGYLDIWGDAAADLPDVWGSYAGTNPNAGKLFLENNWTRRVQSARSTDVRGTVAYNFKTGNWARHRIAGLLSYNHRKAKSSEESEVLSNPSDPTTAEADVNRLYRRRYFKEGNVGDIYVQSWKVAVPGTRWVLNQQPEDTIAKQKTAMVALQSFMLDEKLVTIVGARRDTLDYDYNFPLDPTRRNGVIVVDPTKAASHNFDPQTLTAGAVYHVTGWLSLAANGASSRDLPNLRIHTINSAIPPMPESTGMDFSVKLDLLDNRLYATIGYYKGNTKHTTDWGTIQPSITDRNTKILDALRRDGLISAADYTAHLINANGYMMDRDTSGWEATLVANPTPQWRISANFAINHLIARNSMAEVQAWAATNTAYWRQRVTAGGYNPDTYALTQGTSWDYLNANIGWMKTGIDETVALDGHEARGQRKYSGNLYTNYRFNEGLLKGLSIGGGGRYQSANVLGMYDDTLDGKFNPTVHYGRTMTLFDASMGYSFKTEWAGKGSWTDVQLNVSNVFDRRTEQLYSLSWWGAVQPDGKTLVRVPGGNIGLQEPRKFSLTATLHF